MIVPRISLKYLRYIVFMLKLFLSVHEVNDPLRFQSFSNTIMKLTVFLDTRKEEDVFGENGQV